MIDVKKLKQSLKQVLLLIELNKKFKQNVLIVDGTNRFVTCFSVSPKPILPFLYSVNNFINIHDIDKVICVFDGKDNSKKRKKANLNYKSGRLSTNTIDYTDQLDRKKELFLKLIQTLRCLPITVLSVDNCLADDVIAHLVKTSESDIKNYIMTTDKDFYQLIRLNVIVYNPIKKILITTETVKLIYNLLPVNFIYYKSILGDGSDNIVGVKGIGDKTFKKIFKDLFLLKLILANNLLLLFNTSILKKYALKLLQQYSVIRSNMLIMDLVNNKFFSSTNLKSVLFLLNLLNDRIKDIKNIDAALAVLRKLGLFNLNIALAFYKTYGKLLAG